MTGYLTISRRRVSAQRVLIGALASIVAVFLPLPVLVLAVLLALRDLGRPERRLRWPLLALFALLMLLVGPFSIGGDSIQFVPAD